MDGKTDAPCEESKYPPDEMTRDEAESIVMAAEAGAFKGSRGELAWAAILVERGRRELDAT